MPHPARRHLSVSFDLSLDDAEALHAQLVGAATLPPRLRALRTALADRLRAVAWTKITDRPRNLARLARLLHDARRPLQNGRSTN